MELGLSAVTEVTLEITMTQDFFLVRGSKSKLC